MYVRDVLLHQSSFLLSATIHVLSAQNKFVFLISTASTALLFDLNKNGRIKSCSSYKHIKFYNHTLIGVSFASASEFGTFTFWNGCRHRIRKWYDLHIEFHENLLVRSELIRREAQTDRWRDRKNLYVISLTFLFKRRGIKQRRLRLSGERKIKWKWGGKERRLEKKSNFCHLHTCIIQRIANSQNSSTFRWLV